MKVTLTITDLTRMSGDRVCIAGITPSGHNLRPEFEYDGIQESWLVDNNQAIIMPFAKVQLDLLRHRPHPPHTEDWIVSPEHKYYQGLLQEAERLKLLQKIVDPNVPAIFDAEIHSEPGYYVKENEGARSLGTVLVKQIDSVIHRCYNGRWDYRINFADASGNTYRLPVTDLTFRYYINYLREQQGISCDEIGLQIGQQLQEATVYFRIGLSRPTWAQYPHCCFLQINGIYTFPDYLLGRCFADF